MSLFRSVQFCWWAKVFLEIFTSSSIFMFSLYFFNIKVVKTERMSQCILLFHTGASGDIYLHWRANLVYSFQDLTSCDADCCMNYPVRLHNGGAGVQGCHAFVYSISRYHLRGQGGSQTLVRSKLSFLLFSIE